MIFNIVMVIAIFIEQCTQFLNKPTLRRRFGQDLHIYECHNYVYIYMQGEGERKRRSKIKRGTYADRERERGYNFGNMR